MSKRYQGGVLGVGFNPLRAPNAPTSVTGTAGDQQVSVAFTAPANIGGSAISSYVALSNPGNFSATGGSSPVTVTGLTNGTAYTFQVTALNSYGPSPISSASASVTPAVPGYLASYNPSASSGWFTEDAGTDSSGNLYVFGYSSSFVAKYNSTGVLQWQKTSASVAAFYAGYVDASGNLYAAGTANNGKAYIAKFDTNGNVTAQAELNRSTGPSSFCKGIYVDTSGNVYVTIVAYINCCTATFVTVKLDTSLAITWQKVFNSSTDISTVTVDTSGNVYVADNSSGLAVGKFDASGTALWHYNVNNINSYPTGITLDSSGNPVVTGAFYAAPEYNAFVMKVNANGTLAWGRTLVEPSGFQNNANAVSCDASDNVYFTGTQSQNNVPALLVAKYNSSGTLQWQRSMTNSTWNGAGYAVSSPGTSFVYVAGRRRSNAGAGSMLGKLPSDGSKTGSYTVGSETFTYSVASNTATTPSFSLTSLGTSTGNGGLVKTTPAYTYTNLTNLAYVTAI